MTERIFISRMLHTLSNMRLPVPGVNSIVAAIAPEADDNSTAIKHPKANGFNIDRYFTVRFSTVPF